jgi:hypothetical protein
MVVSHDHSRCLFPMSLLFACIRIGIGDLVYASQLHANLLGRVPIFHLEIALVQHGSINVHKVLRSLCCLSQSFISLLGPDLC